MYIHTHTHAHTPTCMHTYTYTEIQTCMHACIHTLHTLYIHTCMHTYIHTYIHAYIHTYIHTYICTYIHTCIHVCAYCLMMFCNLTCFSLLSFSQNCTYAHQWRWTSPRVTTSVSRLYIVHVLACNWLNGNLSPSVQHQKTHDFKAFKASSHPFNLFLK
jgi:hypothetical protein